MGMDRRKSMGLISAGTILVTHKVFSSTTAHTGNKDLNREFIDAFLTRWQGLRTHTFEVMEVMPVAEFNFNPTKEIMTFARLFTHIGVSLDYYAEILDGVPHKEETLSSEKEEVTSYLKSRFDRFEAAVGQLDVNNVFNPSHKISTSDGATDFSDFDILMLAYNHTVHHKGQATTYLRLNGIAPPQYRF